MNLANFLLIIVGGFNLGIGFYVYLKNWKSQLRLSFILLTMGIALWCVSLALSNSINNSNLSLFWSSMTYVATGFIAFIFLWLSMLFPYEIKLKIKNIGLIFIPVLLLMAVTFIYPSFIVTSVSHTSNGFGATFNLFGYVIFSFYFIAYIALGFYFLIKRYLASDGIIRSNLKLLIIGLGIGAIFGIIFDLILPFGNYWQLNWLGPYFSLIYIVYLIWLIFYKK